MMGGVSGVLVGAPLENVRVPQKAQVSAVHERRSWDRDDQHEGKEQKGGVPYCHKLRVAGLKGVKRGLEHSGADEHVGNVEGRVSS
eukprot:CAMPEP_0171601266 /NCGR_PEP_ID=MMETSP0990-20121206/4807_1 /TAXON_ID=483369 /ORGANISM="non described non described, Strain CCMP2098" /LENGTH=85 /DNA_ID=CAMNT_0012163363 /DNA_START=368 /DNA_END=626 /DNA_ORIENTATION=+